MDNDIFAILNAVKANIRNQTYDRDEVIGLAGLFVLLFRLNLTHYESLKPVDAGSILWDTGNFTEAEDADFWRYWIGSTTRSELALQKMDMEMLSKEHVSKTIKSVLGVDVPYGATLSNYLALVDVYCNG